MKILHLIDSAGLYGAEVMLLNLVREQIQLGLEPVIGSIGDLETEEKVLEREAVHRGFRVEKFRMRPGLNLLGAWKMLSYTRAERFDLVHSHGYKGNILLGFTPRFFRRIPIVATVHGWTNTDQFTRMKIYEWVDAISLRHIDAVVAVNNKMLLNKKFSPKRLKSVAVIYNGIPWPRGATTPSDPQSLDKEINAFRRNSFIIGAIGRLSREKGYKYLIEATHLLREQGLDIRTIIIGEGSERPHLQAKIDSLNLSGRVWLAGYHAYANRYLPNFDIFVVSSITEGLPITVLEAMQNRTPIVATDVGGLPEVTKNGQGGILVRPKSSSALADAIETVYRDRDLAKRLAAFSYTEVTTHYTSDNMARQYLQVYEAVAGKTQVS
jgi:glycosyltransferase involved in cell wall biosynthesis